MEIVSSLWRNFAFYGRMKNKSICSIDLRKNQRNQEPSDMRKNFLRLNFIAVGYHVWSPDHPGPHKNQTIPAR